MKDKYENKSNCNLTTCRYNADGKCTNEENREECVDVSKLVLCITDKEEKNPFNICRTNPDCEFNPEHCIFSVDCTMYGDVPNHIYICGSDKCKYQK